MRKRKRCILAPMKPSLTLNSCILAATPPELHRTVQSYQHSAARHHRPKCRLEWAWSKPDSNPGLPRLPTSRTSCYRHSLYIYKAPIFKTQQQQQQFQANNNNNKNSAIPRKSSWFHADFLVWCPLVVCACAWWLRHIASKKIASSQRNSDVFHSTSLLFTSLHFIPLHFTLLHFTSLHLPLVWFT